MGWRDRLRRQAVAEGKELPILHGKEYVPTRLITPAEGIGRKLRRKMEGNGSNQPPILGPSGRPIHVGPPGLIVLKCSKGTPQPAPKLVAAIGSMCHANVIILPLEIELMAGELAVKEVREVHKAIHMILENSPAEEK